MQRYVFDNAGNCLSFYSLGPSKAKSFMLMYLCLSGEKKTTLYDPHLCCMGAELW